MYLPYSKKIINFNKLFLNMNWEKEFPNTIFFRDYENLPRKSPFDIDIFTKLSDREKLVKTIINLSKSNNLLHFIKKTPSYCLILIFDLSNEKKKRNWIFYETRSVFYTLKKQQLNFEEIAKDYSKGFPIPDQEWSFFFYFFQMIRKEKVKYFNVLKKKYKNNKAVANTAKKKLFLTDTQLEIFFKDNKSIKILRSQIFPNVKGIISFDKIISKLKKKIVRLLIFKQFYKKNIFVLCGPDGVGKSTTLEEIKNLFLIYPFEIKTFHHSHFGKQGGKKKVRVEKKKGLFRVLLSFIYKNFPSPLKELWVSFGHFLSYSVKLNHYILKNHYENNLIFLDRYIYDLWSKDLVSKHKLSSKFVINFVYFFFSKIIYKPRLTFILNDKSINIFKRKKELSINQLDNFNNVLIKKISKLDVPYKFINVTNKSPEVIAKYILKQILLNLGEELFLILKSLDFKNEKKS